MKEFNSFYKTTENRKYNTWCKYPIRLDTYGCGCQHNCSYCYSKALLNFRNLWSSVNPSVADLDKIENKIKTIPKGTVVKLGGMTDCFMPQEIKYRITLITIMLLNKYQIPYLIVTKNSLVANNEYLKIYDKKLAHFQITVTFTDEEQCRKYENASSPSDRIKAIEILAKNGFDVSVRLSPFIPEFVDLDIIEKINCKKILIEFLKVNHWIRKCFDIDYTMYSHNFGGHNHLELEEKIRLVSLIKGYAEVSVGEFVKEHYEYFQKNVNFNKYDCCNLRNETRFTYE
jgi:DNA repair photolyase